MLSNNIESFAGREVQDFDAAAGPLSPASTAYRLRLDWERHDDGQSFTDIFDEFLSTENADQVEALIIGDWGGAGEGNGAEVVVEGLVAKRDQLSQLTALFIGDMISEECEISWINQTDMSPIWSAFPKLQELGIRGGGGLQLGRPVHGALRKLVIEAGGLPPQVIRELLHAQLPMLEHLELWLGTPDYGGDATVADIAPLLNGKLFPKLKTLALRNSVIADDIAAALAGAAILNQIEVLDLSLGTLSDPGIEALAANDGLRKLRKLDIHHHYGSGDAVSKLNRLGIEIDASDARVGDDWGDGQLHRYIFVSE